MISRGYDTGGALQEGFRLFNAGRHQEAVRAYQEVLAHQPGHPEATHFLGIILFERGDLDRAAGMLEHSIAVHPDPPAHYFFNLAILLDFLNETTRAISLFRQTLAMDPDSVQAHSRLGHSLQKNGDTAGAMECYRKAMELDPGNGEPLYFLGTILDGQGESAGALDCYRAAMARAIHSVKTRTLLGNAFNRHGLNSEALSCYRHALAFTNQDEKASPNRRESNGWLRLACKNLRGTVLSIGSGNDFDKEDRLYREYFGNCASYTRLDLDPLLFPDLVGDVQQLSGLIADGSYDVIFSVWALEHVPDVEAALAGIHRALAPGGFFVFGLPLNMEYHSYPCDCHRFTRAGIEALMAGKFHIAQLRPVGPLAPFSLDPRLRLHGEAPETAPYSHVGIAFKI